MNERDRTMRHIDILRAFVARCLTDARRDGVSQLELGALRAWIAETRITISDMLAKYHRMGENDL